MNTKQRWLPCFAWSIKPHIPYLCNDCHFLSSICYFYQFLKIEDKLFLNLELDIFGLIHFSPCSNSLLCLLLISHQHNHSECLKPCYHISMWDTHTHTQPNTQTNIILSCLFWGGDSDWPFWRPEPWLGEKEGSGRDLADTGRERERGCRATIKESSGASAAEIHTNSARNCHRGKRPQNWNSTHFKK